MKKSVYVCGLIAIMSFSLATAQEDKNAPPNIKQSFENKYPNVNDAKWQTREGMYEARFTDDGKDVAVYMNEKSEIIKTEYYLKVSDLPQPTQAYLKKNYAGVYFNEVSKVISSKGKIYYKTENENKKITFDEKGNLVKAEKEKNENY